MGHIRKELVAGSFTEPKVGWARVSGPARIRQEEILCKTQNNDVPFFRGPGLAGQENGIVRQVTKHARTMFR